MSSTAANLIFSLQRRRGMGVLPAAYSATEILCHVAVATLSHVPRVERTRQWSTAILPFGTDLRGHRASDASGPDAQICEGSRTRSATAVASLGGRPDRML